MAGRTLVTLWALGQLLARAASGEAAEDLPPVSYTFSVDVRLSDPPSWGGRVQTRLFTSPDRTVWGRAIPGLPHRSHCCGKVNHRTKIIGGSETGPNAFPWMAALVLPGDPRPFCGGSLINDRYVLTAAHCVVGTQPQDTRVILGKHELRRNSSSDLLLELSEVKTHPLFSTIFLWYDYALLKLATPLQLPIEGNLIAPVCLPYRIPYVREPAVASGWGTTEGGQQPERLHAVRLRTVSSLVCGLLNPATLARTMLCATGSLLTGGADTCSGDSGGPLTVRARRQPGRRMLLGLTSWGIGCALPLAPGVYAKVPAALDWIVRNTPDARYC